MFTVPFSDGERAKPETPTFADSLPVISVPFGKNALSSDRSVDGAMSDPLIVRFAPAC